MQYQDSERPGDRERREVYRDLLHSSLDRPAGGELAFVLDVVTPVVDASLSDPGRPLFPRISLRWCSLPRIPLPILTWA